MLATLTIATPAHATDSTVTHISAAVRVTEPAAGPTGFVELVNHSATSVDLTGWAVRRHT
ncbi:hypothetical protein [Kutzneria sp. CA-103260]|uniref:hypothetical protein n=1 Tax=Kutzneria sp. CA-103260 TaxID=2802641 RepID=UPI001BA5FC29|nr:hypothetical protein [Kutzneria sp. CA-103260]